MIKTIRDAYHKLKGELDTRKHLHNEAQRKLVGKDERIVELRDQVRQVGESMDEQAEGAAHHKLMYEETLEYLKAMPLDKERVGKDAEKLQNDHDVLRQEYSTLTLTVQTMSRELVTKTSGIDEIQASVECLMTLLNSQLCDSQLEIEDLKDAADQLNSHNARLEEQHTVLTSENTSLDRVRQEIESLT